MNELMDIYRIHLDDWNASMRVSPEEQTIGEAYTTKVVSKPRLHTAHVKERGSHVDAKSYRSQLYF